MEGTKQWVDAQFPPVVVYLEGQGHSPADLDTIIQSHAAILAGLCLVLGGVFFRFLGGLWGGFGGGFWAFVGFFRVSLGVLGKGFTVRFFFECFCELGLAALLKAFFWDFFFFLKNFLIFFLFWGFC